MRLAVLLAQVVLALCLCLSGCRWSSANGADLLRAGEYNRAYETLTESTSPDPAAENYLAILYYLGIGTRRDLPRAATLFEHAARRGHSGAQLNLGILYLYGFGVPRDHARAFGWLQVASAAGNQRAVNYLPLLTDNLTGNQMRQARETVSALIVDMK
jgi:TPR repeat protein